MQLIACSAPVWFGASKIIMQLIFSLVTFFIALFAYKVYKISRQRSSLLFGLAFVSVSFAYFIEAVFNYFLLSGVQSMRLLSSVGLSMRTTFQLSFIAVGLHTILMILGLTLLSYVTLKERGIKIFLLLFLLSLTALIMSTHLGITFYTITSIYLLFITLQYYQHHTQKPSLNSLLIFLSFGLLFLGNLQLAFATTLNWLYLAGHFISLVGYLLLLASFFRVVRQ